MNMQPMGSETNNDNDNEQLEVVDHDEAGTASGISSKKVQEDTYRDVDQQHRYTTQVHGRNSR